MCNIVLVIVVTVVTVNFGFFTSTPRLRAYRPFGAGLRPARGGANKYMQDPKCMRYYTVVTKFHSNELSR